VVVDVVPQLTWSSATSVDDPENVIVTGTSPDRTPFGTAKQSERLEDVPHADAASAVPTPVTNVMTRTDTQTTVDPTRERHALVLIVPTSGPP
jgi:hypothetical protein